MTLFLLAGILVILTVVHEAGHAVAVRVKGGRVKAVRLGRGLGVWSRGHDPRWSLALPPFGGKITYDGVPDGTSQAVVAVSGPAANALMAWAMLWAAAAVGSEPDLLPGPTGLDGWSFATAAMAGWFAVLPAALVDAVGGQGLGELRQALGVLPGLLEEGGLAGLFYVTGAGSALWAVLNLVPIPVVGTDGWHVLRSLRKAWPRPVAGRNDNTTEPGP